MNLNKCSHKCFWQQTLSFFICLAFLVYSIATFVFLWKGVDYPLLSNSDAADIASMAAGRAQPGWYLKDELLSDPRNYAGYTIFSTWFIQHTAPLFNYDFSFASLLLVPPTVFFYLFGYYIFGRTIGLSTLAALGLSITLTRFIPVDNDFWGLVAEPLPRVQYAALLPIVLTILFKWYYKNYTLLLTFCLFGLLTYVHPVSGPFIALCVLLAVLSRGSDLNSFQTTFKRLFWAGLAYSVVILPFAVIYLKAKTEGFADPTQIDQISNIAKKRMANSHLDIKDAWTSVKLLKNQFFRWRFWYFTILPVFSMAVLWFKQPCKRREVCSWITIIASTLLVPLLILYIDTTYAKASGRSPIQTDMIRNIKFVVPFVIIASIWSTYQAALLLPTKWRTYVATAIVIFMSISWVDQKRDGIPEPVNGMRCWLDGHFFCNISEKEDNVRAMLKYIREQTPHDSTFQSAAIRFDRFNDECIRYAGHRSLTFSAKDGGLLYYFNQSNLLKWADKNEKRPDYKQMYDTPTTKQKFLKDQIKFGQYVDADYLILPFILSDQRVVYHNPDYSILRLK